MKTLDEYNSYGEVRERLLLLRTSPMLCCQEASIFTR